MATTALFLNCMTAGISFFSYKQAGYLSMQLTWPFIAASIPCAFLGAGIKMSEEQYAIALAIVLFLTALRLAFYQQDRQAPLKFVAPPRLPLAAGIGAALGVISGAVGIGGGIFLSPVIILFKWADPKTTSATAALFIIVNSVSGLIGRAMNGTLASTDITPFLVVAFFGAVAGSYWGCRMSSSVGLRRMLAVVLVIAGVKLFLPH
jgi:uncharacterized membrane protein YfcA